MKIWTASTHWSNQNNNSMNIKHTVTIYITRKCELPIEHQFVSLKSHLALKYDFHDAFHLQQWRCMNKTTKYRLFIKYILPFAIKGSYCIKGKITNSYVKHFVAETLDYQVKLILWIIVLFNFNYYEF